MTEQEKQWRESIYKNGLKDYDYLLNLSISFREYRQTGICRIT